MALLEVEVLDVDAACRDTVYQEVIGQQGPPDGTLIISLDNQEEFDAEIIDEILTVFSDVGEVILVRYEINAIIRAFYEIRP